MSKFKPSSRRVNVSITIPDGCNPDNVEVVALVAAFDETDQFACTAENVSRCNLLGNTVGIDTVVPALPVQNVIYFTLDGRQLSEKPVTHGVYILKYTYSDSSSVISKAYVK